MIEIVFVRYHVVPSCCFLFVSDHILSPVFLVTWIASGIHVHSMEMCHAQPEAVMSLSLNPHCIYAPPKVDKLK
jgi:hypothetical protein